jgi:hypothetical protein
MTEEVLNEITEFAKIQFGLDEIALLIGVDIADLKSGINDKNSPIYLAYFKGQLLAEAELRKSIYQMAKSGSTPAQKQFTELINQNKTIKKR